MKTEHQQNIEATRKGGFGGSDAKLFYKVGLKGLSALNNTDKRRIAVAKGLTEYKAIPKTPAMQKGHDFEDWYAEKKMLGIAAREVKLSKQLANNFDTFFHADFYSHSANCVWELKCVQNTDNAEYDYYEQLQWQILIFDVNLCLVVCDSTAKSFEDGLQPSKIIEYDEQVSKILRNGIKLLDDNWDTLDLTVGEDWTETDLLPFEKMEIVEFTNYLAEIKKLEAEADTRREKVLQFMQDNGIKSISSDFYTVSLVPESTTNTFDKKKLLSEHPEIKETDYLKSSAKKAYVTVKLK